ncbi:MAG: restriction endonuclease subunit S [Phycisphaerales bacterium]|nr:restriction endonuclease subunit S [Phycisphaerales bacterium]
MTNKWRQCCWGDIAVLEYGKALRGYENSAGRIPVFGTNGRIGSHDQALTRSSGVIIGRKGAYRGVHYCGEPFFVIDTAFYLRPKCDLDMRWAYYQLKTQDINAMDSGSAIPSTSRGSFYALNLRLPPLPIQKRIAHILGTLDDKIELNRRMNETLEAMARAIFKSWFVDFDPVHAKAAGRDTGLPKHIADLFPSEFQRSELGLIPKGWRVGKFPDQIDFLEGPGLRNWQYRETGVKFLNIRCIADGDLDMPRANSISETEFVSRYSHFALSEDDIVISTSGTLGRLAIVRQDHLPAMLNTSIIRMRGRGSLALGYLWNFLQSAYFLEEMFAAACGSVQLNFGPTHLNSIKLVMPPGHLVESFEQTAQPIIRQSLRNRRVIHAVGAYRDAILPKLLSGELAV